jgi:hypothetical protein
MDKAAANTGLAKVAVQCSADTSVLKIATFAKPKPLQAIFNPTVKQLSAATIFLYFFPVRHLMT